MNETANERLVRAVAREVAWKRWSDSCAPAEAAAQPMADRLFEAEWGAKDRDWPTAAMPAREWVPLLLEDMSKAKAEFDA